MMLVDLIPEIFSVLNRFDANLEVNSEQNITELAKESNLLAIA